MINRLLGTVGIYLNVMDFIDDIKERSHIHIGYKEAKNYSNNLEKAASSGLSIEELLKYHLIKRISHNNIHKKTSSCNICREVFEISYYKKLVD